MAQTLFLSALTLAFLLPRILGSGINIVTITYQTGTLRFWAGTNPYLVPIPNGDIFLGSPFFCLLYSPFAFLPSVPQALLWSCAGAYVFWAGILKWVNLNRKTPAVLWVLVLITSMELNISLLYQQMNALLTGLMLLGAAFQFRSKKASMAGSVLALATQIKLIPALVSLPMFFQKGARRYVFSFLAGLVAMFLTPSVFLGLQKNWDWHREWVSALIYRSTLVRPGWHLDLGSVLRDSGHGVWSEPVRFSLLVVSFFTLGLWVRKEKTPWEVWLSFSLASILLITPTTESPTFVLIAPAYILLGQFFLREKQKGHLVVLVICAFFVSVVFTDLWPRAVFQPHYPMKTLGTLGIWGLSLYSLLPGKGFSFKIVWLRHSGRSHGE